MSASCNRIATTAVIWPNGQRLVCCFRCYAKALEVGGALGMVIVADELRDGESHCTQNVRDPLPSKEPTR